MAGKVSLLRGLKRGNISKKQSLCQALILSFTVRCERGGEKQSYASCFLITSFFPRHYIKAGISVWAVHCVLLITLIVCPFATRELHAEFHYLRESVSLRGVRVLSIKNETFLHVHVVGWQLPSMAALSSYPPQSVTSLENLRLELSFWFVCWFILFICLSPKGTGCYCVQR